MQIVAGIVIGVIGGFAQNHGYKLLIAQKNRVTEGVMAIVTGMILVFCGTALLCI